MSRSIQTFEEERRDEDMRLQDPAARKIEMEEVEELDVKGRTIRFDLNIIINSIHDSPALYFTEGTHTDSHTTSEFFVQTELKPGQFANFPPREKAWGEKETDVQLSIIEVVQICSFFVWMEIGVTGFLEKLEPSLQKRNCLNITNKKKIRKK